MKLPKKNSIIKGKNKICIIILKSYISTEKCMAKL